MIATYWSEARRRSEGMVPLSECCGEREPHDRLGQLIDLGVPVYVPTDAEEKWVYLWSVQLIDELSPESVFDTSVDRVRRAVADALRATDPAARARELLSHYALAGSEALDDVLRVEPTPSVTRPSLTAVAVAKQPRRRRRRWM